MKIEDSPLHIGMPISHRDNACGTLGAFVLNENNELCLLSCNHVLAGNGRFINNNDQTTKEIYHPGNTRKSYAGSNRHIANVEYWKPLKEGKENFSDSAYARLLGEIESLGNVVPKGFGFQFEGEPIYIASPYMSLEEGTKVYKIGYATGFTTGIIKARSKKLVSIGSHTFSNLIEVEWLSDDIPFSMNGDSGSMAFIEWDNSLYAIGMVLAGINPNDKKLIKRLKDNNITPFSYLCNMDSVLNESNVTYLNS